MSQENVMTVGGAIIVYIPLTLLLTLVAVLMVGVMN